MGAAHRSHGRPLLLARRRLHHIFLAAILFLLHDDAVWEIGDLRQRIHVDWEVPVPLHGVEDGSQQLHFRLVVGEDDDLIHLVRFVGGAGEDLAAPAEIVDAEALLSAAVFLFLTALGGGVDEAGLCEVWC